MTDGPVRAVSIDMKAVGKKKKRGHSIAWSTKSAGTSSDVLPAHTNKCAPRASKAGRKQHSIAHHNVTVRHLARRITDSKPEDESMLHLYIFFFVIIANVVLGDGSFTVSNELLMTSLLVGDPILAASSQLSCKNGLLTFLLGKTGSENEVRYICVWYHAVHTY